MSAHVGGKRLINELLQRLRLLLFRDGAYDGLAHDVAVAVNHIGGGVGKDPTDSGRAFPTEVV